MLQGRPAARNANRRLRTVREEKMTSFCLSHPVGRCSQTVMETIMKPLSIASRSARWLMAAGIAVA